jgi:hypothetical protein
VHLAPEQPVPGVQRHRDSSRSTTSSAAPVWARGRACRSPRGFPGRVPRRGHAGVPPGS